MPLRGTAVISSAVMRLAAVILLVAIPALAEPPERQVFSLYKWQQRIGSESAVVVRDADRVDFRTVFSFTDRGTTVPLAATLRIGRDGAPGPLTLMPDLPPTASAQPPSPSRRPRWVTCVVRSSSCSVPLAWCC